MAAAAGTLRGELGLFSPAEEGGSGSATHASADTEGASGQPPLSATLLGEAAEQQGAALGREEEGDARECEPMAGGCGEFPGEKGTWDFHQPRDAATKQELTLKRGRFWWPQSVNPLVWSSTTSCGRHLLLPASFAVEFSRWKPAVQVGKGDQVTAGCCAGRILRTGHEQHPLSPGYVPAVAD